MRNIGRQNFTTYIDIKKYINNVLGNSGMPFDDLYLYPEEVESLTEEEKLDLMLLTTINNIKPLRIYIIDPIAIYICDYFKDLYNKYRLLF